MRTLIHISDLHFGRFDTECLEPLYKEFNTISPDLIIISGDLTQRARIKEYTDSQEFIQRLKQPYFVIPGNHDIWPLYNLRARLRRPFDRYKKYISHDIEPYYVDNELAIVALNTVRASKISSGKINPEQVFTAEKIFKEYPNHFKILVSHHPFNLPVEYHKKKLVGRSKLAYEAFSKIGVNMYLSGHFHVSAAVNSATRTTIENYAPLIVQAGTASLRQRGEHQSFNVIQIDADLILIQTYEWNPDSKIFTKKGSKQFPRFHDAGVGSSIK